MERALALLALVVLGGFLWILFSHVTRIDLGIVIALTFLAAAYDLFDTVIRGRRG